MDPRVRNEERAVVACRLGFQRLADERAGGGNQLRDQVFDLLSLWEAKETCSPYYRERWRQLLAMPPKDAAAIVLADTDEGARLRHAHPFAALFTADDRRFIREAVA
jgi:hypothetical protein